MKSFKFLLAMGLLFVESSFAGAGSTLAQSLSQNSTVTAKSAQMSEFNYPYDNLKNNLTMENTDELEFNQDWQPILIHGTWSSPDSITHHVKLSFEDIGKLSLNFNSGGENKRVVKSKSIKIIKNNKPVLEAEQFYDSLHPERNRTKVFKAENETKLIGDEDERE